jgi:hypothetical protein
MEVRIPNDLIMDGMENIRSETNHRIALLAESPDQYFRDQNMNFRTSLEKMGAIASQATILSARLESIEKSITLLRQNKVCTVFRSDIETLRQQIPRTEDTGR